MHRVLRVKVTADPPSPPIENNASLQIPVRFLRQPITTSSFEAPATGNTRVFPISTLRPGVFRAGYLCRQEAIDCSPAVLASTFSDTVCVTQVQRRPLETTGDRPFSLYHSVLQPIVDMRTSVDQFVAPR